MQKVLLLAAGKSTRIAGVSGGLPKPLLPVGDRSIIEHNLDWLAGQGVRSVFINLHHRPDDIRTALGNGERYGVTITYSHEPTILGTAGAWKLLADRMDNPSLVVYADNLLHFDLAALLTSHAESGALATIALFDQDRHAHTGIAGGKVEIADDGRVTGFVEGQARPTTSTLVNAGAYALDASLAASIGDGFQDFGRDVFPNLVESGRVYAHVLEPEGFCLGLDTPESYATAQTLVQSRRVSLS